MIGKVSTMGQNGILLKVLLVAFTIGLLVNTTQGQFLNMENPPYLNFGWLDYRNYRENVPIYRQFDYFGNFMVEGFDAFLWEEYRTIRPAAGSVLLKGKMYQQWLNHLAIARDAFAGWSTSLTIGNAVRTVFTPLTLSLTRYNGIRWDMASDNNQFTVLTTRISDPERFWYLEPLGADLFSSINEGAYLLGGHWQTFVGGFLRLGATYLNLHRYDSFRTAAENSWKGVAIRDAIPDTIYVRFSDDSPEDGVAGAAIYSIYATVKVRKGDKVVVERIEPCKIICSPGVVEHPPGYLQPGGYLEASGEFQAPTKFYSGVYKVPVYVDFVFPMPRRAFEVEFATLVANDYRISIRQVHHFTSTLPPADINVTGDLVRKDRPFYPYFPIRRAKGNVGDMSNKQVVRFQYGMLTGMTTMGLDAELRIGNFHLQGEIVRSTTDFQYPVMIGSRSDYKDFAYYVMAKQEIKPFTIGGELFSIGPKYYGYDNGQDVKYVYAYLWNKHDPKDRVLYRKYLFHPWRGPYWYFNNARQDPVARSREEVVFNPVYSLVEDNDDNDIWPDDWQQDWDVNYPERFFEPDAGIFPGWDKNGDAIPDYNQNNNLVPDWDEPFLQYYTEPMEFQYGDDNNNNFIIDAWEDDMLPDYPYYKDEAGKNFYISFVPLNGLTLTWGIVDIHQIAGGGINKIQYTKLNFSRQFGRKGEIWFEHMTKRVKDNIKNDWYEFVLNQRAALGEKTRYEQTLFEDPLCMRNSLVNRGFLSTKFSPIPNLNIINNIRYEINKQYADDFGAGLIQQEDRIDFIGVVNKADYNFRWGNLVVMPQLKLQYERWKRKSEVNPFIDNFLLIPILRVNYLITKRTKIQTGIQGFPLLENRFWDRVDSENTYSARNFIFLITNTTAYQGYKICTQIGWEYRNIDFDDLYQRDTDYYKFFVRASAGIEE